MDEIFELLSDERRRYIFYQLIQDEGVMSVDELVQTIAEWESDGSDTDISTETLDRIHRSLLHQHLPKIDEQDFIEYNAEEGLIKISSTPEVFEAILTVGQLLEEPDHK